MRLQNGPETIGNIGSLHKLVLAESWNNKHPPRLLATPPYRSTARLSDGLVLNAKFLEPPTAGLQILNR